ncbi:hypothetical protein B0J12DRAFT_704331 [Macrophomina phaseolina]|uniref:Uncharacterized protein n=1 Tax=Macrophomina phaseolina TaxID=35725 RepID=A0ABQ8FVI8_9PEZI|nr:hypothetical protein B0J12DRAFT_704331 [Macrophomina phaseolina]
MAGDFHPYDYTNALHTLCTTSAAQSSPSHHPFQTRFAVVPNPPQPGPGTPRSKTTTLPPKGKKRCLQPAYDCFCGSNTVPPDTAQMTLLAEVDFSLALSQKRARTSARLKGCCGRATREVGLGVCQARKISGPKRCPQSTDAVFEKSALGNGKNERQLRREHSKSCAMSIDCAVVGMHVVGRLLDPERCRGSQPLGPGPWTLDPGPYDVDLHHPPPFNITATPQQKN